MPKSQKKKGFGLQLTEVKQKIIYQDCLAKETPPPSTKKQLSGYVWF
jgi:hypothetical protein